MSTNLQSKRAMIPEPDNILNEFKASKTSAPAMNEDKIITAPQSEFAAEQEIMTNEVIQETERLSIYEKKEDEVVMVEEEKTAALENEVKKMVQ